MITFKNFKGDNSIKVRQSNKPFLHLAHNSPMIYYQNISKGMKVMELTRFPLLQGFIILAIIGTEKLIVTEVDRLTEIQTPISHPAVSRCNKKNEKRKRYV